MLKETGKFYEKDELIKQKSLKSKLKKFKVFSKKDHKFSWNYSTSNTTK